MLFSRYIESGVYRGFTQTHVLQEVAKGLDVSPDDITPWPVYTPADITLWKKLKNKGTHSVQVVQVVLFTLPCCSLFWGEHYYLQDQKSSTKGSVVATRNRWRTCGLGCLRWWPSSFPVWFTPTRRLPLQVLTPKRGWNGMIKSLFVTKVYDCNTIVLFVVTKVYFIVEIRKCLFVIRISIFLIRMCAIL